MDNEKYELSQYRMCVERVLDTETYIQEGLTELEHKGFGQLKAAFLKSKIWEDGTVITVKFIDEPPKDIKWTPIQTIRSTGAELDPLEMTVRNYNDPKKAIKDVVEKRLNILLKNIEVKFIENDEKSMVRIGFNPLNGSWSLLGKDNMVTEDKYTMNFGWLDVGTILHEFGHMLGLIHEHQNPFGKKIDWNEEKVYKWGKIVQGWDKNTTYNNIIKKYEANQLNGSIFDPYSVMLYFFPGTLTLSGDGTNPNYRFSYYDIEYISKIYDGTKNTIDLR